MPKLLLKCGGFPDSGYKHGSQEMTPDECETICEFVILESQNKLCHLDMRLLDNAFRDYLQWRKVILLATGRYSLRLGLTDGRKNPFPPPVTGNWTMIFDAWNRSLPNIRPRYRHKLNGAGCGAKAEPRFSATKGHWRREMLPEMDETG